MNASLLTGEALPPPTASEAQGSWAAGQCANVPEEVGMAFRAGRSKVMEITSASHQPAKTAPGMAVAEYSCGERLLINPIVVGKAASA
jgi:hypothetical protein